MRRGDCVPTVEMRRRLRLTSTPAQLAQRFRWFGHAARRPEGELIKDLLLPTPPRDESDMEPNENVGNDSQGRPGTSL